MSHFTARHIRRAHSIVLNALPETIFPLFTPAGEKLWVNDWNPEFFHPSSGETQEGMVFTTDHNSEKTLWSLVEFDPARYFMRYARVTPESRFGFVEVFCEPIDSARTRATVTYIFTALTEAGNSYITEFTAERYRQMINSWQTEINAYLARVR